MKVIIFAKDENFFKTTANLSYDQVFSLKGYIYSYTK